MYFLIQRSGSSLRISTPARGQAKSRANIRMNRHTVVGRSFWIANAGLRVVTPGLNRRVCIDRAGFWSAPKVNAARSED